MDITSIYQWSIFQPCQIAVGMNQGMRLRHHRCFRPFLPPVDWLASFMSLWKTGNLRIILEKSTCSTSGSSPDTLRPHDGQTVHPYTPQVIATLNTHVLLASKWHPKLHGSQQDSAPKCLEMDVSQRGPQIHWHPSFSINPFWDDFQ